MRPIGDQIRELRKERGLSLQKAAADSGISTAALSRIETGARYPTLRTLEGLTGSLGVSFLITREGAAIYDEICYDPDLGRKQLAIGVKEGV
jgi:transcriptional regulator with XRE-family HTH domain